MPSFSRPARNSSNSRRRSGSSLMAKCLPIPRRSADASFSRVSTSRSSASVPSTPGAARSRPHRSQLHSPAIPLAGIWQRANRGDAPPDESAIHHEGSRDDERASVFHSCAEDVPRVRVHASGEISGRSKARISHHRISVGFGIGRLQAGCNQVEFGLMA